MKTLACSMFMFLCAVSMVFAEDLYDSDGGYLETIEQDSIATPPQNLECDCYIDEQFVIVGRDTYQNINGKSVWCDLVITSCRPPEEGRVCTHYTLDRSAVGIPIPNLLQRNFGIKHISCIQNQN